MQKFSVLMSVYYREKEEYLAQALESVFNQTIMSNEVVLVKDGPLTEGLDGVIDRFAKQYDTLKVVALPENVGLGNALNAGLKECSNDLVARMDSDDICKVDRFEKQLSVFELHPEIAIVGSWIDEFENSIENIISQRKLPETNEQIALYAGGRCPFNHPTVMFRKSVIEQVGGYKHFYLFEDYYLWVRVIQSKFIVYNIQESLLYFRSNPQMIARRGGWKYAKSELKLQKELRKMGLIGTTTYLKNIAIRFTVRMMPNGLRAFVYKKMLR